MDIYFSELWRNHEEPNAEGEFPCAQCSHCCSSELELLQHRLEHHGLVLGHDERNQCNGQLTSTEVPLLNRRDSHHALLCRRCHRQFSSSSAMKLHMRLHAGERPCKCISHNKVSCKSCRIEAVHSKTKPSERMKILFRKKHWARNTGQHVFACSFCSKSFTTKTILLWHERCHSEIFVYTCDMCHKSFRTSKQLHTHRLSHASTREEHFMCNVCDRGFMCRKSLEKHHTLHCGTVPQDCNRHNGTQVTTDRSRIESHSTATLSDCSVNHEAAIEKFKKLHDKNPVDLIMNPSGSSSEHRGISSYCHLNDDHCASHHNSLFTTAHDSQKPFHWKFCSRSSSFSNSLKLQILSHARLKPHKCNACSRSYQTAAHLRCHFQAIHGEVRPFRCASCDKTFPYENSLRLHCRLHTGERPFSCSVCDKAFMSESTLRRHKELHLEGSVYACEACSRTYKTSSLLREHRRRHTSDRVRFVCHVCGRRFMYRSALETHSAVHDEVRSYDCSKCEKSFKTYAGLYSHSQVHLSTSLCVCAKCGKSFKTKKHLKAHEKRHLGERRFICQLCNKAFLDRGTLTKHTKTVHATSPKYACPSCTKTCNRLDNLRSHMRTHGDAGLLKLLPEKLKIPDPTQI